MDADVGAGTGMDADVGVGVGAVGRRGRDDEFPRWPWLRGMHNGAPPFLARASSPCPPVADLLAALPRGALSVPGAAHARRASSSG